MKFLKFHKFNQGIHFLMMSCNTPILTPIMYWIKYVNIISMLCMIPSVKLKAKGPLMKALLICYLIPKMIFSKRKTTIFYLK